MRMPNRYEQVLLTYLRQWQFWAYLAAWGATIVLIDILPEWMAQPMAFVFLSLAATGPAAVIGMAKQQIADARASLVPGFRAPHVNVAVALSLGAIVLMPLVSRRALDVSPLGLIASVAICSAAFGILAYFQSVTSVAIAMAGVGLMLIERVCEIGLAMLTGRVNGLALGVIAFAAAVLGYIFYRLSILNEDMPEYSRVLGDRSDYAWSDARTVPPRERVPRGPSLFERVQLAAADRRLRVIGNVFGATPWRRVRHWMLSGELSSTKWAAGVAIAAFLTSLPLWVEGDGRRGDSEPVVAIGALMSVVIPVFCVTATWMSRRRSMGYELTRPVSRQRFVREFGLAVATDLAEWWFWLTAAALVALFVWGAPQQASNFSAHLVTMLVLSAAEQVLAFGILVTILRVRSPRASDGSIMMSIIAVIAPIMVTASIPRTPGTTLAIAAGVAALGAALTYDAYRRWCETDLA